MKNAVNDIRKVQFIDTPDPEDSLFIFDADGRIFQKEKYDLIKKGYTIKVLNFISMDKTDNIQKVCQICKMNPFDYMRDEYDVDSFVSSLIFGTAGQNAEEFWIQNEKLILSALVSCIHLYYPADKKNISTLTDIVGGGIEALDAYFVKIPKDMKWDEMKYKYWEAYNKFKNNSEQVQVQILTSISDRLNSFSKRVNPFTMPYMEELTPCSVLSIPECLEKKTAVFVEFPSGDNLHNWMVPFLKTVLDKAIFYEQLKLVK